MLSRDDKSSPTFLRLIGAAPAVYLLVGVGVWEAFRFLKGALLSRARDRSCRTCGGSSRRFDPCCRVQLTYRTYFDKWA